MNRSIESDNSFLQVLLKLIPSEVIAVFIFVQGVLPRLLAPHIVVAALLVAITPLYLARAMKVHSRAQLVVSTISLVVWIYAMGAGPLRFVRPPYYAPWHGAVALAVWTLVPPMFLASPARDAGSPERKAVSPAPPRRASSSPGRTRSSRAPRRG